MSIPSVISTYNFISLYIRKCCIPTFEMSLPERNRGMCIENPKQKPYSCFSYGALFFLFFLYGPSLIVVSLFCFVLFHFVLFCFLYSTPSCNLYQRFALYKYFSISIIVTIIIRLILTSLFFIYAGQYRRRSEKYVAVKTVLLPRWHIWSILNGIFFTCVFGHVA